MEHNKSMICKHGTQLKLGLHTWNTIKAWFAHMEHNKSLVCTHGTQFKLGLHTWNTIQA